MRGRGRLEGVGIPDRTQRGACYFGAPTIYWSLLQPDSPTEAEPRFNLDYLGKLKRYVERANSRNMQVMFVVHSSPDWARLCDANHKNPEGQDCGNSTYPPHDAMYAWWREFLADLMREFPTVAYWGVWNEPNSSSFFNVLWTACGLPTGMRPAGRA